MSDTYTPDAEDIEALRRASSGAARAELFLKGEVGPLRTLVAGQYDLETAGMAYVVLLAYRAGRGGGILKGRPAYEAWETLAHRVHAAAARSGSLREWCSSLLSDVGGSWESLRQADALWLREFVAVADASAWRRLRRKTTREDATQGARLLSEWLAEAKRALLEVERADEKERIAAHTRGQEE